MRRTLIGWTGTAVLLAVAFAMLRFYGLETSPPGFYVDEAAIAAQIQCVRDSGHDYAGKSHPLFSEVLGGGYATAPTLYLGGVWTSIFGDSIASFRGLSACFGVLFICAIACASYFVWGSREAAVLSALAAGISPWSFQFARIAWDPALAPAFVALSLAFLFVPRQRLYLTSALAGVFAALAAYSYPPIRVQLALVIPAAYAVLFIKDKSEFKKKIAPFVVSAGALSAPLIFLTLRGDIQGRFRMLSVFNPDYLRQFGDTGFFAGLKLFFANLALHFGPSFLFIRGDGNPRHSTWSWGEWSPLDMLAVLVLIYLTARSIRLRKWDSRAGVVAFVVFGYIAGLVPASLTWESNPHALRSIGATVFLALGTGGALAWLWQKSKHWHPVIGGFALFFAFFYFNDYFTAYPKRAGLYFDEMAINKIVSFEKEKIPLTEEAAHATNELREYPALALRYFQVREGLYRCQ